MKTDVSAASVSDKWEKTGWVFLLIFAASDFFSISLAQISAAGMGICWAGAWAASRRRPDTSPLIYPAAAFAVSSLVSAALSLDMVESVKDSKDLLHLFIILAAYDQFRRSPWKIGVAFRVMIAAGGAVAVAGFAQAARRGIEINDRISGFHDMYMTYAGLLMLSMIVAGAALIFDFRKWKDSWIPAALLAMTVAVLLSLTRNAWIGAFAGAAALIAMRKPLALTVIPILAALAFAVSPPKVQDRITSMANPADESNRERVLLWGAGLKIIADYPVFGVGQNSFPLVYPMYRAEGVKEPNISHLHNNFLELAAERGLVGLSMWIWLWGTALWFIGKALALPKNDDSAKAALAASLASIVAFLSAGLFEYNFGDSEIQMMFYFLLAAGVAAARKPLEFAEKRGADLS